MRNKPHKTDLSNPRPGDYFSLTVPPGRILQAGCYRARIESLAPKERNHDGRRYRCVVSLICPDDPDDPTAQVHLILTLYSHPALQGQCFLGPDEFPVAITHEPCLTRRLADSLPPQERLPYADT